MLNSICFSVLILASGIVTQNPIQEYVIHRDVFSGFKGAQFSIYDKSERHVSYRIESGYGLLHNVEVKVYPSQREIGRLQPKLKFVYTAEISIFDSRTNQWIDGLIEQKFQFFTTPFTITWHGHRIVLEQEGALSLTSKFYDEDRQLLAQVRRRPTSIFRVKYDMKIFSDKYPEQIYLLGLAALHHVTSARSKG